MRGGVFSKIFLSVLFLLSGHTSLAQESLTLTRSSSSDLKLQGVLSRDIFRSVPYEEEYDEQEAYEAQEDYTVDIPYQENETYYEDIPYEETESYQDSETYYENERRCHTTTDYVRECRQERQCSVGAGGQNCEMVQECGTNIHGQPICKDRKVCHDVPGREECSNQEVCNSVPVSREECGYEQVPKTRYVTKYRTVTRYRQEQRSRLVTKYRQESRTRTVTRYRTVTKCCVTRYRQEFDHKWSMNVQLILPAQAPLLGNEIEKFEVALAGSEAAPNISFKVSDSVFGYKIQHQDIKATSGLIELALVPKYNESNLGQAQIKKIELLKNGEFYDELTIQDDGIRARVKTQYRYRILNKETQAVLLEGELISDQATRGVIAVRLNQKLDAETDYLLQIAATRSGVVLEKSFSFNVTRDILFQRWNLEDFGKKSISTIAVNEEKDKSSLDFVDLGAHVKLKTSYKVSILTKSNEELWSGLFPASTQKNQIALPAEVMKREEDLNVRLQVQRQGRQLPGPLEFSLNVERAFLKLVDIKDSKKVHSLKLVGQSTETRLQFSDDLKISSGLKTQYQIVIRRHGGFLNLEKKVFLTLNLTAADLVAGKLDKALRDLGSRDKDLEAHMNSGSKIYVDMTVTRKQVSTNTVLATFNKNITLTIP